MEFLVAVVGVLLLRSQGSLPAIQRDQWFHDWVSRLKAQDWLGSLPYGRLAAAVLLPVLGAALVLGLFSHRTFNLWLFLLELLVLLYAFGRGNLEKLVRAYRDDVDREDFQAAYHDAAIFNLDHHEGAADSWDDLHRETLAAIPYRYFERYFPVIFWFLLAGAPGALAYRLSVLYRETPHDDILARVEAESWLWLLEWLPLRLLGLVFALVGNFSTTMHQWRGAFFEAGLASGDVLRRLVTGALDIPEDLSAASEEGEFEVKEVAAVSALFGRALILWLCLAALWVVIR